MRRAEIHQEQPAVAVHHREALPDRSVHAGEQLRLRGVLERRQNQ